MSYPLFKVIHLFGVFLIVCTLSAMSLHMMNGGTREFAARKWLAMVHGIGLLIVFLAGFGMLGILHLMHPFPIWAGLKVLIFLILGGLPALIYRQGKMAKTFFFTVVVLASLAAYLAIYKP